MLHISNRNRKLVPNSETAFIIFSLPSQITCPFATPLCKRKCYIRFAERCWPRVLPARRENFELSKSNKFISMMVDQIRQITDHSNRERFIFRIHEGGDFYSQAYTDKWLRIIDNFSDDKRIIFSAYTKSFPYFDGISIPQNFSLRASIWADTSPEQLAIVAKNGWPTYSAVESFHEDDKFIHCRCEDCAACNLCWHNDSDIRCLIHSGRQGARRKLNKN